MKDFLASFLNYNLEMLAKASDKDLADHYRNEVWLRANVPARPHGPEDELDRRQSETAGSFPMAEPRRPTLSVSLPDQLRNLAEGALGRLRSTHGLARLLFHDQWQAST